MTKKCNCPMCEAELLGDCLEPPFCQPCEVELIKCNQCGASYSSKLPQCPACKKLKQG